MEPYYADDLATLYHGDCREVMAQLPDASVDAVVTDPPYELSFMNRRWDSSGIAFNAAMWAEVLRVLKPGGHILAFGGTRTWHRMAVAIEDAGADIRDSIAWMYGSGFPKSLDVSKAIDKKLGVDTTDDSRWAPTPHFITGDYKTATGNSDKVQQVKPGLRHLYSPLEDAAANWQGWGTALKPAFEPVVVARKPLIGTVAENVLEHGTGALNIDGCRIGTEPMTINTYQSRGPFGDSQVGKAYESRQAAGRWPANVILDEDQAAALDQQSGVQKDGVAVNRNRSADTEKRGWIGPTASRVGQPDVTYGGTGGASRFFYVPKANRKERPTADGVAHPTVKPLALMTYLIRLVTPPGGIVLDPFAGSGTTLEAATVEGFRSIGIELTPEYLPLIEQRLRRNIQPTLDTAS
jgi:DNA modification methylase